MRSRARSSAARPRCTVTDSSAISRKRRVGNHPVFFFARKRCERHRWCVCEPPTAHSAYRTYKTYGTGVVWSCAHTSVAGRKPAPVMACPPACHAVAPSARRRKPWRRRVTRPIVLCVCHAIAPLARRRVLYVLYVLFSLAFLSVARVRDSGAAAKKITQTIGSSA